MPDAPSVPSSVFQGWQVTQYGRYLGTESSAPLTETDKTVTDKDAYYQPGDSITLAANTYGDITLTAIYKSMPGVVSTDNCSLAFASDMAATTYYKYTITTTLDGAAKDMGPLTLTPAGEGGKALTLTADANGQYVIWVSADREYAITADKHPGVGNLGTIGGKGDNNSAAIAFETLTVNVEGRAPESVTLKAQGGEAAGSALAGAVDGDDEAKSTWTALRVADNDKGAYDVYVDGAKAVAFKDNAESSAAWGKDNAVTVSYHTVTATVTGNEPATSVELRRNGAAPVPLTKGDDGTWAVTRMKDAAASYTLYVNGVAITGQTADFSQDATLTAALYRLTVNTRVDGVAADAGDVTIGGKPAPAVATGTYQLVTADISDLAAKVGETAVGAVSAETYDLTADFYSVKYKNGLREIATKDGGIHRAGETVTVQNKDGAVPTDPFDERTYDFAGWSDGMTTDASGSFTYTEATEETEGAAKLEDGTWYVAGAVLKDGKYYIRAEAAAGDSGAVNEKVEATYQPSDTFTMPAHAVTLTSAWTQKEGIEGDSHAATVNPITAVYNAVAQALAQIADESTLSGGAMGYAVSADADEVPDTADFAASIPERIAAGIYYVWYRALGDDTHGDGQLLHVVSNIAKAPIAPTVTAEGWTFGDEAKTPVVDRNPGNGDETCNGAVTYYYKAAGAEDSAYTTDVPTQAGDYLVKAAVAESGNYKAGETAEPAAFTISPKPITGAEATFTPDLVYTGSEQTAAIGTVTLDGKELVAGTDYEVVTDESTFAGTDAGEYTVTIRGKGNYADTATLTWKIAPASPTVEALPEASGIGYGSTLEESSLSGGVAKFGNAEVEGTFAWKEGTTLPHVADSQTTEYPVVFTPASSNFAPVECLVKLAVAKRPAVVTADDKTKGWGEDDPELTATVDGTVGDDELTYTFSRAEGEELGGYEISVAVATDPDANPDYQVTTVPGTLTIVKAKLPVEDLPDGQRAQPKKEVYTGEPQPLVTPPEELPDGCEKVLYSTDGGETWTEDVPTGTDVGDYPVKVRYVGDGNHEDAYEDITGSIEKAPGDKDGLTDFQKPKAIEGIVTDGTPQVLVVPPAGLPQGYEKVQYSLDGGKTWSDELPTASLPGDYTVSVRYVGDANHADMLGDDIPVTVTAIPSYACTSGDGSAWTKGGSDGLAFTFKRQMVGEEEDFTFAHFASASVDGKELVRDVDYTAVEGSVVLTLAPAFLETLAEGGHTIAATFDDGSAEAKFSVKAAPAKAASPRTGDAVPVAACLAIIALAVGSLLVARRKMG